MSTKTLSQTIYFFNNDKTLKTPLEVLEQINLNKLFKESNGIDLVYVTRELKNPPEYKTELVLFYGLGFELKINLKEKTYLLSTTNSNQKINDDFLTALKLLTEAITTVWI
jgi:hypothetical protein